MSIEAECSRVAVIGVGNAFAQDDAIGLLVARSVRGQLPDGVRLFEHEGEPTALLDAWDGLETAILVDAVAGVSEPGTIHRLELTSGPVPATLATNSTHAFNLAAAIELGRVLGRMPRRLVLDRDRGSSVPGGDWAERGSRASARACRRPGSKRGPEISRPRPRPRARALRSLRPVDRSRVARREGVPPCARP